MNEVETEIAELNIKIKHMKLKQKDVIQKSIN